MGFTSEEIAVAAVVAQPLRTAKELSAIIEMRLLGDCVESFDEVFGEGKGVGWCNCLETMVAALQRCWERVNELESERAELAQEDATARMRSERACGQLREMLQELRAHMASVLGRDGMAVYALEQEIPPAPEEIAFYSRRLMDRLEDNPEQRAGRFGNALDTEQIRGTLRGPMEDLQAALLTLHDDREDYDLILRRRNAALTELERLIHNGLTIAIALCQLILRYDISKELRRLRNAHEHP